MSDSIEDIIGHVATGYRLPLVPSAADAALVTCTGDCPPEARAYAFPLASRALV